jgi:chemotaxis protein CheD
MDNVMNSIVGVSEFVVSNKNDDVLVTYSLGSCLGVTIYDSVAQVGGMIHCMLPYAKINPEKAKVSPAMFVDTGIPEMFEAAYRLGAQKNRIILKVTGASRILDSEGIFNIGDRNYATLRKLLWHNNILIAAENVGGTVARNMYLEINTGRVIIKTQNEYFEL